MSFRILLFALTLTFSLPTVAQRVELDDSLSPRQKYSLDLKWSPEEIGRAISAMFNGRSSSLPPLTGKLSNVDTRLNTRKFIGQSAKIYLLLPIIQTGTHSPSNMQLNWQTRGKFLSGSARPGQSTLVFEGVIEQAVTQEIFDFVISIEDGDIPNNFILEPKYEIEVTP